METVLCCILRSFSYVFYAKQILSRAVSGGVNLVHFMLYCACNFLTSFFFLFFVVQGRQLLLFIQPSPNPTPSPTPYTTRMYELRRGMVLERTRTQRNVMSI